MNRPPVCRTSRSRLVRFVWAPGRPTTNTRACTLRAALAAAVTVAPLDVSLPSVRRTSTREAPRRSPTLWLAIPTASQIAVPDEALIEARDASRTAAEGDHVWIRYG